MSTSPFAAALRKALPEAELVVDHWHLDKLANLMVTQVRQRVTQQALGHRGLISRAHVARGREEAAL